MKEEIITELEEYFTDFRIEKQIIEKIKCVTISVDKKDIGNEYWWIFVYLANKYKYLTIRFYEEKIYISIDY